MADKYMTELADSLGMPLYLKQSTFGHKDGVVIGTRDGFLVAAGPGKNDDGSSVVKILVRYKEIADVNPLLEALEKSESLKMLCKNRQMVVGQDFLLWSWQYSLSKPKASFVADFVIQLLSEIRPFVSAPEHKCEMCSTSSNDVVLFNGVPGHYCGNCQLQTDHNAQQAAGEYASLDSNLGLGLVYGSGAALAGSLAWGGVAYITERIFAWGAILIGWLVGQALFKGMGKVNWAGRIAVAVLTVASIMFGDVLFYTFMIMKEYQVGFNGEVLNAAIEVFKEVEFTSEGGVFSIIFALVGAGYAIYSFRPPDYSVKFEQLGAPEYMPARGASAGMA